MDDPSILWARFLAGDSTVRNDLVLHYLPLVNRVAAKIKRSSSPVPIEDLRADGAIGLMDAIDKFDPNRGVRFEAYAVLRIRGAIIDGVRATDWVPRGVRSRRSRAEHSSEVLTHRFGRTPLAAEVASHAGLDEADVGPADEHISGLDGELLEVSGEDGPEASVDVNDLRRRVDSAIACLGDRERILFSLYYNHNLTLSQIGAILGVTEAYASQIHTRAVRDVYAKVSV